MDGTTRGVAAHRAWAIIVAALAVVWLCADAHAAEAQAAPEAAPAAAPEAAPAEAPAADPPEVIEARQHIASGEAFLTAENFDAALVEFQRAYDLLEGNPIRFIVLYNIGQCHERMFRYDLALEFYRRYLEEGGENAEDRATVQATMRALDGLLATLVITSNVPTAEVWVDARQVATLSPERREVRIPGGVHTVELRMRGFVPEQQQVQVAARSRTEISFTLEQLSEEYRGIDAWVFWSSGGVAVACALGGAVVGVLALTESQSLQAKRDDLTNPERFLITEADNERVKTLALTADVLFGGAVLFGATAVTLAFLTDWDGDEAPREGAAATTASLRLVPAFSPTSAGFSVSGQF
jgi:tetratricopeptide (TPR) repeat protein